MFPNSSVPCFERLINGEIDDSKFSLISVDSESARYLSDVYSQILLAHTNFQIHIISLAYDFRGLSGKPNLILYDFQSKPFTLLGEIWTRLQENRDITKKQIVLIDNLSLLVIHSEKQMDKIMSFIRALTKYSKFVTAVNVECMLPTELKYIIHEADLLFNLTKETTLNQFSCGTIKVKSSGKITTGQDIYEVMDDGKIRRLAKAQDTGSKDENTAKMLATLTSFKLTLEADEEETRSQLHLPYFKAQSTGVLQPEQFDDYEDDDEEV